METILIIILAIYAIVATTAAIVFYKEMLCAVRKYFEAADAVVDEAMAGNINDDGFNSIVQRTGFMGKVDGRVKVCHKCGRILPLEDFSKKHAVCKECRRKQ